MQSKRSNKRQTGKTLLPLVLQEKMQSQQSKDGQCDSNKSRKDERENDERKCEKESEKNGPHSIPETNQKASES